MLCCNVANQKKRILEIACIGKARIRAISLDELSMQIELWLCSYIIGSILSNSISGNTRWRSAEASEEEDERSKMRNITGAFTEVSCKARVDLA